ncbi:protein kinase [Streptomyces sp. NA04227]|uniref:protein kinase domain-containing protein n=1 Tax=Streptomyces sp. NA04227 TaxID=2742136 RepID=UPI0015907CA9|nr:protein kinase [Streptomyces sp. NA04227]QKW08667.1 protein kinase [Streptomyces sp. NA04227]
MEEYAGRVLAERYRLPLPVSGGYDPSQTRAFDTYSGQEVLVRHVPLPEVVEAELLAPDGAQAGHGRRTSPGRRETAPREVADPVVRRAIEAAQAAAQVPDHPRLDQVFDVFAEDGALWIVSELVPARSLATFLAEAPLSPYRAAEVAADVVTALRALHAHGWVHRNITPRTVLICDDGRVMLTGLAAGAAEEALCGYDPRPEPTTDEPEPHEPGPGESTAPGSTAAGPATGHRALDGGAHPHPGAAPTTRDNQSRGEAPPFGEGRPPADSRPPADGRPSADSRQSADGRPRAGSAIAAYHAGTRAVMRLSEENLANHAARSGNQAQENPAQGNQVQRDQAQRDQAQRDQAQTDQGGSQGGEQHRPSAPGPDPSNTPARPGDLGDSVTPPPGQIADPYGVHGAPRPWHGSVPRAGHAAAPAPGAGDPDRTGQRPGPAADDGRPDRPDSRQEHPGSGPGAGVGPGHPGTGIRPPAPRSSTGLPPLPVGWDPNPAQDNRFSTPNPAQDNRLSGLTPGSGHPDARPAARHPEPTPGRHPEPTSGRHPDTAPAPAAPGTRTTAPAPAPASALTPPANPHPPTPRWDSPAPRPPRRGPATALAAERARQARMTLIGPVTERWAPEQAVPVHENWQLAAPIGPATDLWALGALLFRAVQGHAPYPEESTGELVQLVCAEPPAFAEECGPLRPVVESLLRQDPTERLDFEELRGWLRSLVRSAPEPEAGAQVVAGPPADPHLLPIKRRRGELVRRWRRRGAAGSARHRRAAARKAEQPPHERHEAREHAPVTEKPRGPVRERPAREKRERAIREPRTPREPRIGNSRGGGKSRNANRSGGEPRSLGRTLLVLILSALVAAVVFAMMFLPEAEDDKGGAGPKPAESVGQQPGPTEQEQPGEGGDDRPSDPATPGSEQPQNSSPELPAGFVLRKDDEGFRVGMPEGWQRAAKNGHGQVLYTKGEFTLLVTPGRDSTATYGDDPMTYQREREYELQPFRDSTWATSSGMRSIDVGGRKMAEGQFTWQESDGREVYVRNLAMVFGGRYHVLQIRGPETERDEVTRLYEAASASYRYTG